MKKIILAAIALICCCSMPTEPQHQAAASVVVIAQYKYYPMPTGYSDSIMVWVNLHFQRSFSGADTFFCNPGDILTAMYRYNDRQEKEDRTIPAAIDTFYWHIGHERG